MASCLHWITTGHTDATAAPHSQASLPTAWCLLTSGGRVMICRKHLGCGWGHWCGCEWCLPLKSASRDVHQMLVWRLCKESARHSLAGLYTVRQPWWPLCFFTWNSKANGTKYNVQIGILLIIFSKSLAGFPIQQLQLPVWNLTITTTLTSFTLLTLPFKHECPGKPCPEPAIPH